jgi:hypothetical protein
VLLPLFRQLGFHRVTNAGHKDKALEYGKDVWMKFTLPTTHVLYFGIQAKKGKLDASGVSQATNANVAEIHNQVMMMLGHEIFDPEIGKRVLIDHAFIVAGGEITKAARNWLGNKLDATKRSQLLFMDRDDILNLYVVPNRGSPWSNRTLRTMKTSFRSVRGDDVEPQWSYSTRRDSSKCRRAEIGSFCGSRRAEKRWCPQPAEAN